MLGGTDPSQNPALAGAMGNYARYADPSQSLGVQNAQDIYGQANRMVSDPMSDPTIAAYMQSAIDPLTRQYEQTVGNTLAGQAVGAGGLGGSRQGVAEGEASRGYMSGVGDISSSVMSNAFNRAMNQQLGAGQLLGQQYGQAGQLGLGAGQNLSGAYGDAQTAQARALGLAPGTMQAGMMPYDIMSQIGGQYQGQQQQAINEAMQRFGFNQDAGYNRAADYLSILQGTPWGGSTQSMDQSGSRLGGALGGGALGYGIGSSLFPASSLFGAGLGPMGMLGGALLGSIF